jgi:5-methylcytosine-specific restriction enzyme subunit McrC
LSGTVSIVENHWYPSSEITSRYARSQSSQEFRKIVGASSERLKKSLGLRMQPLVLEERRGTLMFRASGIAGALQLGKTTFQIVPKFIQQEVGVPDWHETLLAIVRRASRKHFHYSRVPKLGLQRATFIDHVAMAFVEAISSANRLDPIRVYRTVEERSPVLRGRLSVNRQVNALMRGDHKLQCDVDYLDPDNDYNQLLHWAVRKFASLVTDPVIRLKLSHETELLPIITGFGRLPTRLPLNAPPQYPYYGEALELASHLARGFTHSHRSGVHDGYGYVLNMERVFESFIERTVQRVTAKRPHWTAKAQVSSKYAIACRPGLRSYYTRPDNVIYIASEARLLIDAKYKSFSEADEDTKLPQNSDLYQMFASLVAHGCTRGVLVYPRLSTESPSLVGVLPASWKVTQAGTELKVTALSVSMSKLISTASFEELEANLVTAFDRALE